jgi:LysR family transcriptional regulator, regulator for bpeEF and oprC
MSIRRFTVFHMLKQSFPSLAALEAFVAVADQGSFTAAARTLGASKVALSRAITGLERDLGEPLLVRSTRSVRPTPTGEAVRRLAADVLERTRALQRAVVDSARDPSGELTIVATQVLCDLLLEVVVVPFMKRHPRVTVHLDAAADPLAPVHGHYDMALLVGPAPDSALGSVLIGRARLGCFAGADYLARHGEPETPDDLSDHPIVAVGRGPVSWSFTRGARTATVSLRPRLSVSSHDLAQRAAARGAGITRLPLLLASRTPLVRVLEPWAIPEVPAYAVFPSRERPPAAVRAFLDLMKERLTARRRAQPMRR